MLRDGLWDTQTRSGGWVRVGFKVEIEEDSEGKYKEPRSHKRKNTSKVTKRTNKLPYASGRI